MQNNMAPESAAEKKHKIQGRIKWSSEVNKDVFAYPSSGVPEVHRESITRHKPRMYRDSLFTKLNIEQDIEYKEAVNCKGQKEKLLLDLFSPAEDTIKDKPAIIWVHGGGMSEGSKDNIYPVEKYYVNKFAKKGYVTVNINYRLRPDPLSDFCGAQWDAMEDVLSALDWMLKNSANYGVDKNKIILAGFSAGAEIITNLCYTQFKGQWNRENVMAVIDLSGNRLFYGDPPANSPPCLVIHGANDTIHPVETSKLLVESLKKSNTECVFKIIDNANHFFNNDIKNLRKIEKIMVEFLFEKLGYK
jgi:acetyl esterase/lipase